MGIVTDTKVAKLWWMDHVQRMNSNEMAKRIMENTPIGRLEGPDLDGDMVRRKIENNWRLLNGGRLLETEKPGVKS